MKPRKLDENLFWVGAIDWDLRDFHGYKTQRGSTYNSYLILDQKKILIDTVKAFKFDEMLSRISSLINPDELDYIVVNHVEMDHSGSLPKIMSIAKNAKIITNSFAIKGLLKHFDEAKTWNFVEVKTNDIFNIGSRNLRFFQMPMLHWPDSMATYLEEDKILMPNDAFGQHLASSSLFDSEVDKDILMYEAKKYYANIILCFDRQVKKALEDFKNLEIKMICPSHGMIWRDFIGEIVDKYKTWSQNIPEKKCLIIYDTMWNSTEKIANAIYTAFEGKNIKTVLQNLKTNHISDIITELLDAEYICVGSPTLNNNILPSLANFLTYLKGLAPKNKKFLAFGSYGWGGQSIGIISKFLEECGFEKFSDDIKINYIPTQIELENIKEAVSSNIS